ncbi:MAG: hypothetical protein ACFFD4_23395 [Candidatus Odinarchaeota archaeon]
MISYGLSFAFGVISIALTNEILAISIVDMVILGAMGLFHIIAMILMGLFLIVEGGRSIARGWKSGIGRN